MSTASLLSVRELNTRIYVNGLPLHAVCDFEIDISEEEVIAIIGESGCGKTMSALSITGLIPKSAKIIRGEVYLEGKPLDLRNEGQLQEIRGSKISYIFQDATSCLNPIFTISDQIMEMLFAHKHLKKKEAKEEACRLLELVDLTPAEKYFSLYPHQLSGGMNQRVMIAIAIASSPRVIIADEPTSNLDRITEIKILGLLSSLKDRIKSSIIFISHDISTIEGFADSVVVMYAGRIIEKGTKREILSSPKHPYTQGLLSCVPKINTKTQTLSVIKGQVPELTHLPSGCKFHPRCPFVNNKCKEKEPEFYKVSNTHFSRCYLQQKT